MAATSSLRSGALADLPALADRYPAAFRGSPGGRAMTIAVLCGMGALAAFAFWRLEFSLSRLVSGSGQLLTFVGMMIPPSPGSWAKAVTLLYALAETIAIAFLGTLLAAIVAFPLSVLAARNTTANRVLRFFTRRLFDGMRGIDKLIWALIWINVVGLGPFAGVLAFMMSDIGEFGKVYSDAIESADEKPGEGVIAAGGSPLDRIRFGVLPGVLPVIAGQTLYYFESNVRGGTIIGIVGAGGIGLHLAEQIRVLEWGQAAFIILLILAAVSVIDAVSSRLRLAIIGRQALVR